MPLPLETARLIIRPFVIEDAEAMHLVWADPEAMRYIPAPPSETLEVSRQRVQRHIDFHAQLGHALWAVVEKVTGEVIGDCGLIPLEGKGPEIEVGYHFRRDRWGLGFATEAAAACLRYGFDELKLEKILAVTYPENAASCRVLEKIGMSRIGLAQYYDQDVVLYKIRNQKTESRN